LSSRIGFRFLAVALALTRRGGRLQERLQASGVRAGQIVLDYACGPGFYSIPAARLVGPSGHVFALDIQPAAAVMVEARARAAGLTNVTTITSACGTSLPDGTVDLVLLYDAIAGIADKRAVLAEIDRVLRPGGVLSVWVEHGRPEATVPLITGNSRFILRERKAAILDFSRPPEAPRAEPA